MINTNSMLSAEGRNFNFVGWKAYQQIKKKAMEQKFSWSGLLISLSIAFFIVLGSACALNSVYHSMMNTKLHPILSN